MCDLCNRPSIRDLCPRCEQELDQVSDIIMHRCKICGRQTKRQMCARCEATVNSELRIAEFNGGGGQ